MGIKSSLLGSNILNRLGNLTSDFINVKVLGKLPCFYYDKVNNVGDTLNSYLLQQVSGKEAYIVKTKKFSHIMPIGSILHFSTDSSYVWGSGLISPDKPPNVKFAKILALRGSLTRAEIRKQTSNDLDVPLGDPALLMPKYFQSNTSAKCHRIGIVPHYVDQESAMLEPFRQQDGTKIISVQQNYDSFIDELEGCDFILSSSLHGLILADAYSIPNKWISLSNQIIGGEFKFKDYYSTTSLPDETCFYVRAAPDLLDLIESITSRASVKRYIGNLNKLEQALKDYI